MALDLSRFIATFFDEAGEHLETIEERAMALGPGSDDPEILNTIFRAAHSIKGGAATFAFKQLAQATHDIETLFDKLRKGEGKADEATVRLVLDACDVFKSHLARLKAGERGEDPDMVVLSERIAAFGAAPAANASAQGSAYGLFEEPAPKPTEESMFDTPEPVAEAPAAAPAVEKYGFFEPAPTAPAPAREHVARASDAPAGAQYKRRKTDVEVAPGEFNRRKGDASSIRVSVEKIDRIVNLVGELVIAQAMVQQSVAVSGIRDERLGHSLGTLDRNTRELQQAVMSIRMMPMEFVFSRFPRLVYDVAQQVGKKVHLATHGHETELDKELIEQLVDPLTHVVRNAIDHGIESPEERRQTGKPEEGSIDMRATHRGGSVIIEVSDDGRGLDRDRILAKARELGLATDDSWTDEQVWGLIFEAGFTTAKTVTNLSGRGVGMDVVRRNIVSFGGSVSIASRKGHGTTITLQLPLTLAVLDGMLVGVGDEQYIVPLEFVAEAFKPAASDIRSIVGQASLVAVRGEHLPIVRLDEAVRLQRPGEAPADPICLVVEVDRRRAALLVDNLIGQQQLVVKSLDTNLHSVPGVAGATILGDGRVALILDVSALTRNTVARSPTRVPA
jgi:two-component system chemotaxis sensor kinase CheA